MKELITHLKTIALIIALCPIGTAFGQGTEDFNNVTGNSSYKALIWTGTNGESWNANDARGDQKINGAAICIRQTNGLLKGILSPEQQAKGIGTITFIAKNSFASDAKKRTKYKFKCGSVTTETIEIPAMGSGTVTITSPAINSFDAQAIEISIISESGVRVTIDDLSWTAAVSPTGPVITATPTILNSFSSIINTSATQDIDISGSNLTTDITLGITGTDATQFSITPSSIAVGAVATPTKSTITYTPTAVGNHTATLTLSSTGATDITYQLTGTAILPTLTKPIAKPVTDITANTFVANWDVVANATSYNLNVSKKGGTPEVVYLNETFNACTGTGGNDGSWSGSIATGDLTNILTSWSHSICNAANSCIKAGSSSKDGSITTPALVGLNGTATLSFRAGAWIGDNTNLKLSITDGGTLSLQSVTLVPGDFTEYTIAITNGTPASKITFKSNGLSKSRFFLDDVKVFSGGYVDTPITGSPFTVTSNTSQITGLDPVTKYVYSVTAKANEYNNSEVSNEIFLETAPIKATNLATILDGGVDNVYYEIGLPLQGICADGGYLYAKTENGVCSHISKNTNTPPADPAYEDNADDFDQSDWIALKIANPENYVNKTIEAGLIGKYLGTELPPTLEVVGDAKTAATTTLPYTKNRYEVRNIKGESKNNPADHKVFFVKSKINEVATFVGRIYKDATTSVYTLNTEDGDIELDNSNGLTLQVSAQGDKVYQEFAGVLRANATQQPLVKVLEASKILTGVENIGNDNAQSAIVIGGNNSINITCNEGASVMICDITGKIISNIAVADSNVSVEIPAGIYIVKVDNKVTKVIVK